MRVVCIVLLAICSVCSFAFAAEELTSRDFGYGYMVKVQENGAVYSLPLPKEVYTKVRRADLGDVRVFNGAGEAVPHALRLIETTEDKARITVEVPFFPLFEKDVTGGDSMSLSVRRNVDGTIIDIDSSHVKPEGDLQPTGYLLDLGDKPRNIGNLEVIWRVDKAHTSSAVMVQHSTDLQRWLPLVQKTSLIDLEYEGNRIEQRKVQLPSNAERYLKIIWLQPATPLTLTSVSAISRPLASKQQLQWVSLYNGEKIKDQNLAAIAFSSQYRLPVRNVRLQFPEQNSIIHASIQSRADVDSGWREQCQGVFYSLMLDGEELQSEPCSFSVTTDNQWRLVVLDDGAGIASGERTVTLDLGWQSGELLFLARGTGPFVVAYGSGKLENLPSVQRTDMILTAVQQQQTGNIVREAVLGKQLELGGENALQAPPPPKPWKTWLLWGVLVGGVMVMGWMVMSLMKDLRKKDEEAGTENTRTP